MGQDKRGILMDGWLGLLFSSEMTLIFSQPSGGSRTNEYDLLGRGLATTLKVSGDSHLSISFSVFSQLESAPLEGREESIWPGIMGMAGLPEWEPLPELASSTLMVGVVGGSRAPEGV